MHIPVRISSKNFLPTYKHIFIRHAFKYLYNASNLKIHVLTENTDKVWLKLVFSVRVFSVVSYSTAFLRISKLNVGRRLKKLYG